MLKHYIQRNYLIVIYIFLILLLPVCLEAVEFDYEKINDFAIGGNYCGDDKIIIDSSFMYIANRYGLEIQSIDNETGNLERIATMGFIGMSNIITKKDNFIYIASTTSQTYSLFIGSYLYKIDVTTPGNPIIVDSLFCDDSVIYELHFYNNNLICREYNEILFSGRLVILNHQNLEEINSLPICCRTYPINDSLFITSRDGSLLYDIYNIKDINNIFIEATIDLTNNPSVISLHYYIQQIDSTTVGILGDEALALWDISDIHNWEFITDYYTYTSYGKWADFTRFDNYIIIPQPPDGIEVVDITDITNPSFSSFWMFSEDQLNFSGLTGNFTNSNIKYYNNFLYWGTPDAGIFKYSFYDGTMEFINNEKTHPNHSLGLKFINIYDDYIFIPTKNDGIYIYNVSNIEMPELETTLLDSCKIYGSKIVSNKLYSTYVNRDNDIRLCVFDILYPYEPIIQSDFETEDGFGIPVLIINDDEQGMLYCFYWWWYGPNHKIVKYDMTDPTNPEILFDYALTYTSNGKGFFNDGYFYVLDYSSSYQDLYIYGGFEENEPELIQTIYNFGPNYHIQMNKVGDYLHTNPVFANHIEKFYIFETPFQLVEKFSTEYSLQQFSFINDDILFQVYEYCLGLFDLSGNPSGYLESFDYIYFNGWCPYLNFYTQNNNTYFISTQTECASIYSYNSNSSTDDENIYNNEISLSSHPNPFSTSTTISIKFNHPTSPPAGGYVVAGELSQIKIYNIKGQLVRTLAASSFPNPSLGMQELVWDGKDGSGNDVKSGVYFYKLSSNVEFIGKVVKLR